MKYQPKVFISLGILLLILWLTSDFWEGWFLAVVSFGFSVYVFLIAVLIFLENRNPQKTLTWLVVLAAFPIVGFIFYILFGSFYRKRRKFRQKARQDAPEFAQIVSYGTNTQTLLEDVPLHQQRFFRLAHNIGLTPISIESQAAVLTNGEETYAAMIKAMEQANHHIHLEYYIIRDDQIGRTIRDVLIKKAKAGVEVRLIYDSVGCFQLSRNYVNELHNAGVQVEPFNPVNFPILNSKINFRTHRKIVVVDGHTGFVGGLNIGDEYLGKNKAYGLWRDTHMKIEGEAVRSLQTIFLLDWYHTTGEKLLSPQYLSPRLQLPVDNRQGGGLQIISSGPDHEWEVMKKLYFSMINTSTRKICIASPYLIPDEDILSALKIAALSGLEVNILLPGRPDKKIVFYASQSYFTELLEAGVNIYTYTKGFLHSKILIVDDELASVGSANMDMRSFHFNFEVNAFLYRHEAIDKLVENFKNDMQESDWIDLEQFRRRKWKYRVYESVSRLFSPLL